MLGGVFGRALLLLLLPACLGLVYVLWRTSRVYMPPVRRRVSLGLRMAIVALLVSVLAEPRVQLPANDLAVAFLLDRSDSEPAAIGAAVFACLMFLADRTLPARMSSSCTIVPARTTRAVSCTAAGAVGEVAVGFMLV